MLLQSRPSSAHASSVLLRQLPGWSGLLGQVKNTKLHPMYSWRGTRAACESQLLMIENPPSPVRHRWSHHRFHVLKVTSD